MIRRSLDSENASIAVMMYKRAGEEESAAGSVGAPAKTEAEKTPAAAKTSEPAAATEPPFANDKSQSVGFPAQETKTSEKPSSSAKPKPSSSSEPKEKPTTSIPTLSHPGATASDTSAASNTAVAASENNNSETLSGSAIGAIVAIVCIILLGVIAFFFMKRRQKKKAAMNNRLTRFSMGPTYNATTAPGGDAAYGYSTAMSNNTSNNYSDPFAYNNNNNANAYNATTTPMTYNNAAPTMDYNHAGPVMDYNNAAPVMDYNNNAAPVMDYNNAPGYTNTAPQMGYNNAPPMDYNNSSPFNQPPQQPFMPQPTSPIGTVTTGSTPPMPEPMSAPVVAAAGAAAVGTAAAVTATQAEQAGDQQQAIGTYTVVAGYMPALSDEIQVRPGDQVQVFVEYDDGWCLGANLTTGQQRGVFPKHCISPPTNVAAPMATDPLAQQQPQQQQQLPVVPAGGLSVVDPKHQSKRVSSLYSNPQ